MALVLDDGDVCNSWEDIEENSALLEKQLARLKVKKSSDDSDDFAAKGQIPLTGQITLDSTREESLRTQYQPPEPKLKILTRPKESRTSQPVPSSAKAIKPTSAKTLQQREEEYAAARMRILGDVRFPAEEAEAEMESNLSPAEILKLKVAEAIRGDPVTANNKRPPKSSSHSAVENGGAALSTDQDLQQQGNPATQNGQPQQPHRRNKRSREKVKTSNPEPQRDFPVPKTESDRIIRHPRGPDGSIGFNNYRS